MPIADVTITLESSIVINPILTVAVFDNVSETLIQGANVEANSTVLPEVTQGEYEVELPSGSYSVNVSKQGYITQTFTVSLFEDTSINVYLDTSTPGEEKKEWPIKEIILILGGSLLALSVYKIVKK